MKTPKIIVGSRHTPLALVQIEEIKKLLLAKKIKPVFEQKIFRTQGDIDQKTLLTDKSVPDDFFTNTLDESILKGKIDIAIHSAKDLPASIPKGLKIFALTKSIDETDAFVGKVHFKDLKKGAKVGTSSLIRQSALKKLNPSIELVNIRGSISERIALIEKGLCDGVIVATAALKRLELSHLIKDIMPWEAAALQGQLAVVGRSDDDKLRDLFSVIDIRKTYGRVFLVGAGPGDPDLITHKGINALKEADCVFYDYLVDKRLLSYAPKAEHVYVGKRKGDHTLSQKELSRQLRLKAMTGKNVVRLKGGDPLVFGRGADEIQYLKSYSINVEVIPGVSSATGLPSLLGIPLTARGVSSSVAFLSAHGSDEAGGDQREINIPQVDTIVFLMGLTRLKEIVGSLLKNKWNKTTPVVVISKGTQWQEHVVVGTIGDIVSKVENEELEPPALIIVGEVGRFYKPTPKSDRSILYTGTNLGKYRSLGHVIHFPMIEISKAKIKKEVVKKLIKDLTQYDLFLITSRFGVKYFFEILKENNFPLENISIKPFIVIGEETAEALESVGIKPALIGAEENSQSLFLEIKKKFNVKGKKILFPRSALPNPFLKVQLTKIGAKVEQLAVYQNIKPKKRSLPENTGSIIFTSPSTVKNFLTDYRKIPRDWQILSKGPATTRTLELAGYRNSIVI